MTTASRIGYSADVSRDRQRAVEGYARDRRGRSTRLCAQCGSPLVPRPDGASCGTDVRHVGTVPAPRPTEETLLLRMERGGFDPATLPVSSRPRLAFLIQERHGWGQHRLCRWFPVLLHDQALGLGCEAPRPASINPW